jgi:Holliday junction resolvase-like predicted endonuclease
LRWSSAKEEVRQHTPERYREAAFWFLLDREPKESILRRFDVTAISRYFPEFEREMPRYLSHL